MQVESAPLSMWTVYERPMDRPDSYVARRWVVRNGQLAATNDLHIAEDLVRLRRLLPQGLERLPRDPEDDPVIVETWI